MLENIYNYASLAITIVTTIIAIVKLVQAKKSSGEAKATAEENEKLRQVNTLAKIVQQIPSLITKAEELFPSVGEYKFGAQKLEYVLRELQILCMQANIEYQESEFTYEIEKILSTPQKGDADEKTSNA